MCALVTSTALPQARVGVRVRVKVGVRVRARARVTWVRAPAYRRRGGLMRDGGCDLLEDRPERHVNAERLGRVRVGARVRVRVMVRVRWY